MPDGEVSRRSTRAALRFGAALLLVSAAYFATMYGMSRPRLDSVPTLDPVVARYAGESLSLDPTADHWQALEPVTLELAPQAARAPFGTQEREIRLRAAYSDRDIAFLMEYADDSEDGAGSRHPDGAAVMLAPASGPATAQMMGHGGRADIWHWVADDGAAGAEAAGAGGVAHPSAEGVAAAPGQRVRSLLASGPGTQAEMAPPTVEARGVYSQGRWTVVFKRSLAGVHAGELAVTSTAPLSVAFAVWDGSRGESLSVKSISVLRPLRLGRD